MDFDKTSFSVDWFTPGDKYAAKRLSFPKSARISIDDLVSDSPLSFCFGPLDEVSPQLHSYSFVDTPFERACGWTNSAPPSPLAATYREQYPMYDQDAKLYEEDSMDPQAFVSPGLLSIANDCALCGVDLDVSCLDALDEQLLVSPVDSFIDVCWETAVKEDVVSAVPRGASRPRARSFKCDRERDVVPPFARDYPTSFDRTRPLAAKITLPLGTSPYDLSSPSSDSLDQSPICRKKPAAHILYTDSNGRLLTFPAQEGLHSIPRYAKKRGLALTPSSEYLAPDLRPSQSNNALRALSDACATFARPRRK